MVLIHFVIAAKFCFLNSQTNFLLESKDYFGVDASVIGDESASVYVSSVAAVFLVLPLVGYLYEILGRRLIIAMTLLSSCICVFIVPYTSPNLHLLKLVRSILGIFEHVAAAHPLNTDYVKSDSRGKGITLTVFGSLLGEVFGANLLGWTGNMDITLSFQIVAGVSLSLCVLVPLMMREPSLKLSENDEVDQSLWEKIKSLTSEACTLWCSDNRYLLSSIGSTLSWSGIYVALQVYYILWVKSFTDSGLTSDAEVKNVFKDTLMIGTCVSLVLIPLCGQLADEVPAYIFLPIASAFRGIVAL